MADTVDIPTALTLIRNLSVRAATRAVSKGDVDAAVAWFMDEATLVLDRVDLNPKEQT